MGQSLTPRSKQILELPNSLKDELFSIYLLEYEARGVNYFAWLSMMPEITDGVLLTETPTILLRRLAANPSIISIMLAAKPEDALMKVIHSDDNDVQVRHVTDFLDDITINCRLRNPELFDRNHAIFKEQLQMVKDSQTDMDAEEKMQYEAAITKYGYLLMTLHYLRKVGYNNVTRERRSEA